MSFISEIPAGYTAESARERKRVREIAAGAKACLDSGPFSSTAINRRALADAQRAAQIAARDLERKEASEARMASQAAVAARVLYERKIRTARRATPAPYSTMGQIKEILCQEFSVPLVNFGSPRRSIALVRQIGYWLAHTLTQASDTEIGRSFGGYERTTVRFGRVKIGAMREADAALMARLDVLADAVRAACCTGRSFVAHPATYQATER